VSIAVAIKTGTAVVLAADSRVAAQAVDGTFPDGSPHFSTSYFDTARRLARDRTGSAIAAFTEADAIGLQASARHFTQHAARLSGSPEQQDEQIASVARKMSEARAAAPRREPADSFALVVAVPLEIAAPRIWRLDLRAPEPLVIELLKRPGPWLEGAADHAFGLLFGPNGVNGVRLQRAIDVRDDAWAAGLCKISGWLPVNRIHFDGMPLRDAIDLATFLVRTQITMERFLPNPAAGGPIDVLTIEGGRTPVIRRFAAGEASDATPIAVTGAD